jgi:hypothetical protein
MQHNPSNTSALLTQPSDFAAAGRQRTHMSMRMRMRVVLAAVATMLDGK